MPQVDKATFAALAWWTLVIYVGGFLFLNSTTLYTFLSSLKLSAKHATAKYTSSALGRYLLSTLLLFPCIAL